MSEVVDITPAECSGEALAGFLGALESGDVVAYALVSIKRDGAVGTGYSLAGGRSDLLKYALLGALGEMDRRLRDV